ncbi:MAG: S8 family serine peptidase [Candidatus Heimdallarchaeaceae archaeon]
MKYRKNIVISLIAISLFLASMLFIQQSLVYSSQDNNQNKKIYSYQAPEDEDGMKIDPRLDLNDNHLKDSFEKQILSNVNTDYEAIITYKKNVTPTDRLSLTRLGISVLKDFTVFPGVYVKGEGSSILKLINNPLISFIEDNPLGKALLYDVTSDFHVREVWQGSLGYGYTGDSSSAIAILDTGVDDSHLDSNFNIAYWQDFVGANYTVSGDEYVTATDKGEHGTHCASIAASAGAQINNGTLSIQDSGFFPNSSVYAWYGTWFYSDKAQTVTINCSWESGGTAFVGILNSTSGWVGTSSSSSSPISAQFALPSAGWYCPMYGNSAEAGNNYYSGELIYDSGWTNPYGDSFGVFAGVAPTSKIVALKVLDDLGIGPAYSLLNALQWLYDHGQSYGVTVASLSIGWNTIVASIDTAISNLVRDKGIVCVVAAGNRGTSSGGIFTPASSPDCIAVGAVNKASEIAYYSSVGSALQTYLRPDVVAPGGSFAPSGSSAPDQPIFAGDSNDADEAACPFVAGLVQLVVDAMKDQGTYSYSWETAKKIKQIICMATSEVRNIEGTIASGGETYDGDSDGVPQNPPIDRTKKDYTEGWGVVNPLAAVQAVTKWFTVGSSETFDLSGRQNGTHTAIRQISLEANKVYRIEANYVVSNLIDADVLLFDKNPDQFGDPILIANCSLSLVANDSTIFRVTEDGDYYLVVKWVDGNYEGK